MSESSSSTVKPSAVALAGLSDAAADRSKTETLDARLDVALEGTFPASDPIALSSPAIEPKTERTQMSENIAGIKVPDSALAKDVTELVRDTETDLLYHHSRRVFFWGALTGRRRGLKFDPELLYVGTMFHDMGLTTKYANLANRFEVDGANAARDFLKSYGVPEREIEQVWTAIALHTTPGIPEHMHPTIALVTAGVEMDVLGIAYREFSDEQRDQVCTHHPRGEAFKERIIDAFYNGMKARPLTTFGTVNADVLEPRDSSFKRENFCAIIRSSDWQS